MHCQQCDSIYSESLSLKFLSKMAHRGANRRVQQWATFARNWWIVDAKFQSPFYLSNRIKLYLEGKHKPIYHPLSDVGDHVVVFNTKHIAMRDDHWRTFKFYQHSGYPGGFKITRAYREHEIDPTAIIRKKIYSYIKGTLSRRTMMERLHLFPEEDIPEEILKNVTGQIRQTQPVPKPLHEYSEEEIRDFPKLFDWPEDHIMQYGQSKKKPADA